MSATKFLSTNIVAKPGVVPLIIFSLALLLRLLFLNFTPSGISSDELHFILNAKAVYYNFSDMSGRWNPLSFSTIPQESSSELPFVLIAPIIGPLPLNLFTARLPYALFGSLTVLLIYLISKHLFPSPTIALLTSLAAAFNPWSIYTSRTSFDAPLAIFFLLLAFYLLLVLQGRKILFSFLAIVLAFYCYIGTKVLVFPYILFSSYYVWKYRHQQKFLLWYLILNLLTLLLSISFVLQIYQGGLGQRTEELTSLTTPTIIDQVVGQRSQSIDSIFSVALNNKYTVYLNKFVEKYLYSFSTDILFLHGDHTFMVSLWKHGYFYALDFIFILLGLAYLFSVNKKLFLLFISIILLSPIPEAIRADNLPAYAFHSCLQYPFLFIILGLGLYSAINSFFNKTTRPILVVFVIAVYSLSFVNFIYIYAFRYPVYQPEGFNFSKRVLSHFLALESTSTKPIYVLASDPNNIFRSYLFFNNLYQKQNFDSIKNQYLQPSRTNFNIGQIFFTNNPQSLPQNTPFVLVVEPVITPSSYGNQPHLSINRLSDQNPIFNIYNATSCAQNHATTRPSHQFSDLSVEHLDDKTFCHKYLNSP